MSAGPPSGPPPGAPGGGEVIRVVALWRARPHAVAEVRRILHELATLTRDEDGCLSFEALEATTEPGQFVLLEEYAGESGRQRHLGTDHFRELVLDRAVPLLTHRDVKPYEVLRPGPGGRPDETAPAHTGDH